MRAIFMLFDSLSRHYLPPYGNTWVQAPNFQRLADRAVTFDRCYVGSMPCIPARRELHTGRYNFLHRSWGPIEPFDDSTPEILGKHGIHTHLVTDHYHYWEDGGATYLGRYNSFEIVRGQEGDKWKGQVADPPTAAIPRQFATAGLDQPPLYGLRGDLQPAPDLRPGPGIPRPERHRGQLAAARRVLRPASALRCPPALPRALSRRLRRAALRLAAVRPRSPKTRAPR